MSYLYLLPLSSRCILPHTVLNSVLAGVSLNINIITIDIRAVKEEQLEEIFYRKGTSSPSSYIINHNNNN